MHFNALRVCIAYNELDDNRGGIAAGELGGGGNGGKVDGVSRTQGQLRMILVATRSPDNRLADAASAVSQGSLSTLLLVLRT